MRSRRDERGALSSRGVGFGLAGLALVACSFGLPGHGGGPVTSPTTSTLATTTTVSGTTTTTTAPVTTTTAPGVDPCATENATSQSQGRFPCTVNTGPQGATLTVATNNGTSCTLCPAGVTYSGGEYRIASCVAVDKWKFVGDMYITATNGDKGIGRTEAATKAAACVRLTHVLIAPPEPGADNEVALETGFSGGCCGHQCTFNAVQTPCGSVYLADSEISMAQPRTSFNYALSDTNLHLWRDYVHGGPQGIDCDGFCEVHDSYLRADRSEAANTGAAHGDAYFQDGGAAPWMLVDHNKLFCGASMIDCNVDGAFIGDNSAPSGGVVQSNLFMASTAVNFCMAAGASESAKPFPVGNNLTFKNNVYELGPGGTPCTHGNAVKTWGAAGGNHFCNNKMSDGSLVNAAFETGACP